MRRILDRATAKASPRNRRKLVYSLLAVLVFVGLAPLASFAFKLIDTSRRALVTSQQELELQLASSIAGQIDAFVDGLNRQISTLAQSFGIGIEEQGLREFQNDLSKRSVLGGLLDDQLVALRFTPLDGRIDQALMGTGTPPAELEALLAKEYARIASAPGSPDAPAILVSDPVLIGPRGFAGVVVSVPVFTRGQLKGVLQGFGSLDNLWSRLALGHATGHEIYAIDTRGRLFLHTDPEAVSSRRSVRDLEIVQKFLASHARSKETVAFSANRDGRKIGYLGAYDPTNKGWGIFVQVEERAAYSPIQEMMRDTATWAAVALLLAVLAGIVFARRLSRPMGQLAAASRAFANGDFTARAKVESRNEIGELADTFNLMADELQAQITRLKDGARETNDLFLGTVRALAQAIDAKDPYTKGHSVRVNKYAVIIARYLDLSEREIRNVHVASLLHDVGKIGIDDAILKKPASLSKEEFEIMKQHPEKGAKIMGRINALRDIVPGMRHHHERYGGGGYPSGLKGEEIPLIARIVNVADTLDAMTTNRPYQAAFPFEAAVARINELKGAVCDPKVVEAFNRAYHAGEFDLEKKQTAAQEVGQPMETV
jgi:HD-GYP domain-containing protein (c-di-GMP phosphodiesterase class II)